MNNDEETKEFDAPTLQRDKTIIKLVLMSTAMMMILIILKGEMNII